MKQLFLALLLLSYTLSAKVSTKRPYYKVHEVQENNKGALGKAFYKIGDFCFSVVVGVASNSKHVKKIITEIEIFFNDKTRTHKEILEEFSGKIHADIIENVEVNQASYRPYEAIKFHLSLKKNAYVYIVSLSNTESCLVYPNSIDDFKLEHIQGEHIIPSDTKKYYIASDGKLQEEIFYVFSSERPLYFDNFKKKGLIVCANRNLGIQTIAEHQNNSFGDYRQLYIPIK